MISLQVERTDWLFSLFPNPVTVGILYTKLEAGRILQIYNSLGGIDDAVKSECRHISIQSKSISEGFLPGKFPNANCHLYHTITCSFVPTTDTRKRPVFLSYFQSICSVLKVYSLKEVKRIIQEKIFNLIAVIQYVVFRFSFSAIVTRLI
jgi:hypothetical protein